MRKLAIVFSLALGMLSGCSFDFNNSNGDALDKIRFIFNAEEKSYGVVGDPRLSVGEVVIPSQYRGYPVTTIEYGAFHGCESLTSVVVPENIIKIEDVAFSKCTSLRTISLPDSLISIGSASFDRCSSLTSITLPKNLTKFDEFSIDFCYKLREIVNHSSLIIEFNDDDFNKNVRIIDNEKKSKLKTTNDGFVIYDDGKEKILIDYIQKSKTVVVPDFVTSIGDYAFYQSAYLTSITLPDSVISIGKRSFESCCSLRNVTFSKSVKSIGERAFQYCDSLVSLELPDSLISIGDNAFEGCYKLVEIVNNSSSLRLTCGDVSNGYIAYYAKQIIGNKIYSKLITIDDGLIIYNDLNDRIVIGYTESNYKIFEETWYGDNPSYNISTSLTEVVIPNNVTVIGRSAFKYCVNMVSIILPRSLQFIDEEAFLDCVKLTSIINYSGLDIKLGDDDNGYIAYYAKEIIDNPNKSKLMKTDDGQYIYGADDHVIFVGSVSNDNSITLDRGITVIGPLAFFCCTSLTEITIKDDVELIGSAAFKNCINLKTINLPNKLQTIYSSAFENCKSLEIIYLPNMLSSIGPFAFNRCLSLKTITLPNSVNKIDFGIFHQCSSLEAVTLSQNLEYIPMDAFFRCYSLTSITIPNTVASIGEGAFASCISLSTINFSSSLSAIYGQAFTRCVSLASIVFPTGLSELDFGSIAYCKNLRVITIPNTIKNIPYGAFSTVPHLQEINFMGTKEEWNSIIDNVLGFYFGGNKHIVTVYCLDGNIILNN